MPVKHRAPTPSLLAGLIAQRPSISQPPIQPGHSSPIYVNNKLLGNGTCVQTGNGIMHLAGYVPASENKYLWEVKVPHAYLQSHNSPGNSGYALPKGTKVVVHERGTPPHNHLSRYCVH